MQNKDTNDDMFLGFKLCRYIAEIIFFIMCVIFMLFLYDANISMPDDSLNLLAFLFMSVVFFSIPIGIMAAVIFCGLVILLVSIEFIIVILRDFVQNAENVQKCQSTKNLSIQAEIEGIQRLNKSAKKAA